MVERDDAAIRRAYLTVDQQFRSAHTGAEAEYLVPKARQAFHRAGVNLTETQLEEYADCVADDRPFDFILP
jgi:hypothetical protein